MARKPSKARVEGAAAQRAVNRRRSAQIEADAKAAEPIADENGPEPIDLSAPALANPVPGDDGEALERIAEYFRLKFPDEWAEWRNCPLQYGLEAMAGKLKGQG